MIAQTPDFRNALLAVVPVGLPGPLQLCPGNRRLVWWCGPFGRPSDPAGRVPDRAAMPIGHRAQSVAKVAPQMPPVTDLPRLWSAPPDAVGEDAGPIAGDHLNGGMVA
nr:hypothetical protein [Azospirillum oryzae]